MKIQEVRKTVITSNDDNFEMSIELAKKQAIDILNSFIGPDTFTKNGLLVNILKADGLVFDSKTTTPLSYTVIDNGPAFMATLAQILSYKGDVHT